MKEKENNTAEYEPVEIPFERLEESALDGIINDFVLREGTDYGSTEYSLETKIEQVKNALKKGSAKVFFDPHTETCTILTSNQWIAYGVTQE